MQDRGNALRVLLPRKRLHVGGGKHVIFNNYNHLHCCILWLILISLKKSMETSYIKKSSEKMHLFHQINLYHCYCRIKHFLYNFYKKKWRKKFKKKNLLSHNYWNSNSFPRKNPNFTRIFKWFFSSYLRDRNLLCS